MDTQQNRMRTERGRRKIQGIVNSAEADLDDPDSGNHDLNPKNRALFLMKLKKELTEDAARSGVLLSIQDLKPFDDKIKKYFEEIKKMKKNVKAGEAASAAPKKKEKNNDGYDMVGKLTKEERDFILSPESSFNVDPKSLQTGGKRKTRRRKRKTKKRRRKSRRKTRKRKSKRRRKLKKKH
tara:strand:+ start:1162 stop:1704 length:543 start_codon:yes stop_codon:yes gene_type:complete